jgi:uncharacterized protein YajQ (UPF0234 family)
MPTFDVVSEVDMQEVRNAVDQAAREISTRFDFKGTESSIELKGDEVNMTANAPERLKAVVQVLEEKLVKRQVSLKVLEHGKPEEGSRGILRQTTKLKAGIDPEKAKKINVFLKELKLKGVSSTTQGDQIRVTGKKRDDLQAVMALLKGADLEIPLQFENFRD